MSRPRGTGRGRMETQAPRAGCQGLLWREVARNGAEHLLADMVGQTQQVARGSPAKAPDGERFTPVLRRLVAGPASECPALAADPVRHPHGTGFRVRTASAA